MSHCSGVKGGAIQASKGVVGHLSIEGSGLRHIGKDCLKSRSNYCVIGREDVG